MIRGIGKIRLYTQYVLSLTKHGVSERMNTVLVRSRRYCWKKTGSERDGSPGTTRTVGGYDAAIDARGRDDADHTRLVRRHAPKEPYGRLTRRTTTPDRTRREHKYNEARARRTLGPCSHSASYDTRVPKGREYDTSHTHTHTTY